MSPSKAEMTINEPTCPEAYSSRDNLPLKQDTATSVLGDTLNS